MDEVDGMSSGDRGGTAELILMIRKAEIPIVCIANDRKKPALK
jgi:replication factor C subunit 1